MEPHPDTPAVANCGIKVRRFSPVTKLCILIVVLTVIGGGLLFVPFVGMIVGIVGFCCFDFYVYFGAPLIVLVCLSTVIYGLMHAGSRKGWFARCAKAAILTHGVVVTLAIAMGILGGGFSATQEAGFWVKMNYFANVGALREWALNYTPDPNDGNSIGGEEVFVPRAKWPVCVAELKPQMVQFTPKTRTVHLIFGGGFGHWGLSVGPRDADGFSHGLPVRTGAWVWASE